MGVKIMTKVEFGSRLKELRMRKGHTQASLAALLNVSESTVRMWELGRNEPDHQTTIELSTYLGCSPEYLIAGGLSDEGGRLFKLDGLYLHLAKEAQEMGLDQEDVDYIINFYKRYKG